MCRVVQLDLISLQPLEQGNMKCPSKQFFFPRPKQEISGVELKDRKKRGKEMLIKL